MTSELEQKKLELEAIKRKFQETYRSSSHVEDFHSWIEKGSWGVPLPASEFPSSIFSKEEIQKKIEQKEKNNQVVKDYFLESLAQHAPFSTEFMCEMHGCLFNRVMCFSGCYREGDVELHKVAVAVPSPRFVPFRMSSMESTYNHSEKNVFDILRLNYDIVVTQPFIDGNKTIARTMLNYELLNQGYTPVLFSSKADKEAYITSVEKSFVDENMTPFYQFMSEKMASTALTSLLILQGQNVADNVQGPRKIATHDDKQEISSINDRQKE